jgi:hypothetical protein
VLAAAEGGARPRSARHRLITQRQLHHYSALYHLATLLTRIAACWRRNERYVIRDVDGRRITTAEMESTEPLRH